jgi:hypothetical protein
MLRNLTILHGGVIPMSTKRRILALLLSLVLTSGVGPAWAVSFIDDSYRAFAIGGLDIEEMTDSDTTFCVLTLVSLEETDTFEERGSCQILDRGDVWVLHAFMGADSDASAFCGAACFTNN